MSVDSLAAQPLLVRDDVEASLNWALYEEVVHDDPCYTDKIGTVSRSTQFSHTGSSSLEVHANAAKSTYSNHLIASRKLGSVPVAGRARFQTWAFQAPAGPGSSGQTGPELSIQSTKLTGPTYITSVAGVQYLPQGSGNPWQLWQQQGGLGTWLPLAGAPPIQRGTWYLVSIEADFTVNRYVRFSLRGGGLDYSADLSGSVLGSDPKGFGEEATQVTLEAENQFTNCTAATDFAVFYDDISFSEPPAPSNLDYDGDTEADVAVYRPGTGEWFARNSSTGAGTVALWGAAPGDVTVPGDYDGDGKTDIAVYRPATGQWFVRNSSTGFGTVVLWGVSTDTPVPGDYDGDGRADIAVYRPGTGEWFVRNSSTGFATVTLWGLSTDTPLPADYDGDGRADVAVWRPGTGEWFIRNSSTGFGTVALWGVSTDRPEPGDYDGDGRADVAVWRPSTGTWYVNGSTGVTRTLLWGITGDRPLPVP